MSTTFTLGASTVVTISGDDPVTQQVQGSPPDVLIMQSTRGNVILGDVIPAGAVDANGDNFAVTVVLPAGTYSLGTSGGTVGDITVDSSGAGAFTVRTDITNLSVVVADTNTGTGGGGGTATGLSITVPNSAASLTPGKAGRVPGIKIAEPHAPGSEGFSVVLTDTNGDLAVTAHDVGQVKGGGTTSLTIVGTLAQLNTNLATLIDTDPFGPEDLITVAAGDASGDVVQTTVVVSVKNSLPIITAPTKLSVTSGSATPISGLMLAETGAFPGETFTVTLSDKHGDLAAVASGSATIVGSSSTTLTIAGSLTDVNNTLASVTDTSSAADSVILRASDSIGGKSTKTIAVTLPVQGVAAKLNWATLFKSSEHTFLMPPKSASGASSSAAALTVAASHVPAQPAAPVGGQHWVAATPHGAMPFEQTLTHLPLLPQH